MQADRSTPLRPASQVSQLPEQDDEIRSVEDFSHQAQAAAAGQQASAAGGAPGGQEQPEAEMTLLRFPGSRETRAASARPTDSGGLNRWHGRPSTLSTAVLGGQAAPGRTALGNLEVGSHAYIRAPEGFQPTVAPRAEPDPRFTKQGGNLIASEVRRGGDTRFNMPWPGLPGTKGIGEQHGARSKENSLGKQAAAATLRSNELRDHLGTLFGGDVTDLHQMLTVSLEGELMVLPEAVAISHALHLAQGGRPGSRPDAGRAVDTLAGLRDLCRNFVEAPEILSDEVPSAVMRAGAALASSGKGLTALEHMLPAADAGFGTWRRKALEISLDSQLDVAHASGTVGNRADKAAASRALAVSARDTAVDVALNGPEHLLGSLVTTDVRTKPYPRCHPNEATRRSATENWAWRQNFRTAGPDSDLARTRAVLDEVTGTWVDRFEEQAKRGTTRRVVSKLTDLVIPPRGSPYSAAGMGAQFSHLQETPDYRRQYDEVFTTAADALIQELQAAPSTPERAVARTVLGRWGAEMRVKADTTRPHEVVIEEVDRNLLTTDGAKVLNRTQVNFKYLLDICKMCDVRTAPVEHPSGDVEMVSLPLANAVRAVQELIDVTIEGSADLKPENPKDFASVMAFLQEVAAQQRSGATLRLSDGRTRGVDTRLPLGLTPIIHFGPHVRLTYSDNKVLLFTQGQHGSDLFLGDAKTLATYLGPVLGISAKIGEMGVVGGTVVARALMGLAKTEGVRIRTVRKFTDSGAVKDESRDNNPDYHNDLMADVVALIGRHAEERRLPGGATGDLLDKIAAMDFEGENISVGYQRQQTVDMRADFSGSLSVGYEFGGSVGLAFDKTLFNGQARVDQTGAMQRTVAIFQEASNWRQFNTLNVQIPGVTTSAAQTKSESTQRKQTSTVGLTNGRLGQYATNYGDNRLATHFRIVHMNRKCVEQLFYKEEFYGTIGDYENGLNRNWQGWNSMIGTNQVREHLNELRRLDGNRSWNHVARSRMRPEYIAQYETALALIDMYQTASVGPDTSRGEIEKTVKDLRGFVANLLADKETERQVWVPIGLFSTENSTTGEDRGLNFLAVNNASSSAYGEREFLFRGASMGQIAAAFSNIPAAHHPDAPPLPQEPAGSQDAAAENTTQGDAATRTQPVVLSMSAMPEGTVSEIAPTARRSISTQHSSLARSSAEEGRASGEPSSRDGGTPAPTGQFLTPQTAQRPRRSGSNSREGEQPGTQRPQRFTPPPSSTATVSRARSAKAKEPAED